MLFPKQRKSRTKDEAKRRLNVETLECRRLLSADGIMPETDRLIAPGGIVSGTKWEDTNANGMRDPGEQGLAGVTIYADMNLNGVLDPNEPSTITEREDQDTRFEEGGRYQLFVPPGEHMIREIVPSGFAQTYPGPGEFEKPDIAAADDAFSTVDPPYLNLSGEPGEIYSTEVAIAIHPQCIRPYELDVVVVGANGEPGDTAAHGVDVISHSGPMQNGCGGDTSVFGIDIITHEPEIREFELGFLDIETGEIIATIPVSIEGGGGGHGSDGHWVEINQGDRVEGVDFGNHRLRPVGGSIEGRKWLDRDGDGEQDASEPGLGGVTIYVDANNNGQLDRSEPQTVTQFDDPFTDFDEGGLYRFGKLEPGMHTVREVVPEGYAQTFPLVSADVISSQTGKFEAKEAFDFDVTAVDYSTSGDTTTTTLGISASWPNGCGQLIAGQTAHAVIGNTIIVDAHGKVEDGICTLATKTDTVKLSIPGLDAGRYSVVGTLHEGEQAALGFAGEIEIGANGAHVITVEAAGVVSDVNFGNRQTGDGESVSGTKWNDLNGDGGRQRGEPGLGGVTIYVDMNNNGVLDEEEPFTVSSSDADNLGNYEIDGLEPGTYHIREVVPEGYRQTSPGGWWIDPWLPIEDDLLVIDPLPPGLRPVPFDNGSHYVELGPGSHLEGLDFGNQSTEPGAISGTKWLDENGNGQRDEGEEGLGGVTIYVDMNYSGSMDEGEPSAVSDDAGNYTIKGIRPGNYSVQEVIPDGYHQTFPAQFNWWWEDGIDLPNVEPAMDVFRIAPFPAHFVDVIPGGEVEGIDFGNQKVEAGSISGVKWNDENGNQVRDIGEDGQFVEEGIAGVTIYVDLNFSGSHDENEPTAVTDEAGQYTIKDLKPFNSYTIREVVPDGYEQTFPFSQDWIVRPWEMEEPDGIEIDRLVGDIAVPFPFPADYHSVYVGSGQEVEGIDFGNRKVAEPGFVSGSKWEDANGNGQRDADESGLPGFTIFVDSNRNGHFDFGEQYAVTEADNPDTDFDESGRYAMKVRPGSHLVLEQQQRGYEQTYPDPSRELIYPFNRGHSVDVQSGQTVDDIHFGNKPVEIHAVISGTKWFDHNANGVRDRGEEPVPGVTIYLDANDNGQLDEGERSTVTGGEFVLPVDGQTDPLIPFQIGGYYSFDVKPGDYIVREVIPEGYIQTYPFGSYELGESVSTSLDVGSAEGFDLINVETTTTSPNDAGQSETVLTFETAWPAHEVDVHPMDVRVEDGVIYVDLNAIVIDLNPEIRNVHLTSVSVGTLEFGDYEIRAQLLEEQWFGPDEEIEPPFGGPSYELSSKLRFSGDDAHRVSVGSGDFVSGLDFGNIAVPILNGGADSHMGEDPHSGVHDESATHVEFHDGHLQLNSYVDNDGDQDVFQFVSQGHKIQGEGGRLDGGENLSYELLDEAGNTVATANNGEVLEAETVKDETYYLRIAGGQGQYQLDVFQQIVEDRESVVLDGDTDGDGDVDFSDFLTVSSNFGREVDGAFADGDFNGDDLVTFADFLALSANFGKQA